MGHRLCAVLSVLLVLHTATAVGKCKVSKVRAVCESRCEKDARQMDRTAVPPPGTLLPPTGIFKGIDEGKGPEPVAQAAPSPADGGLAMLEVSETATPRAFMTCEDVETHLSPVALLSWAPAHSVSFGCVDGRSTEGGVGTWGGDMGEFISALNVYEQMASLQLSQADVTHMLRKYLSASTRQRFTTCMSSTALKQLVGRQIPNTGSVADMEAAIKSPLEDHVAAIWLKITDPNYIGNDHVRFMLERPEDYSVRKQLVEQVIHSFFDILWNQFDPLREKLRVQVLDGERTENAVASVTVPDFCLKQAGLVPLIPARGQTASVAIFNPDAVQVLRKELALFFSRMVTPVVRADEMAKRLAVLTSGQATLSKKAMFDHIPVYSARISQ